jgi:hypothetical protein
VAQFSLEAFQWHGVKRGDAFAFYAGDIRVEGPHPFCSSGGNLGNRRTRTAMYTDSIEQLRGTAGARQVRVRAETALARHSPRQPVAAGSCSANPRTKRAKAQPEQILPHRGSIGHNYWASLTLVLAQRHIGLFAEKQRMKRGRNPQMCLWQKLRSISLVGGFGFFAFTGILIFPSINHANELSDRAVFWRAQAFRCEDAFPSKFDASSPENCDDGDMTLFNGLLCLSGEQIGCDAVEHSFVDGRWWRSPRRVGWEYPNCGPSAPPNLKCDVSFSPDQALGALSYIVATRNSWAFEIWVNWIKNHPGKLTVDQIKQVAKEDIAKLHWQEWQIDLAAAAIASALPDRLTYCTDDFDGRCTLRPGDCALIKKVGSYVGTDIDLCNDYLFSDKVEELFKSVGLQVPTVLAAAGSFFNDNNYPLHLAGVQVFILQKLGERDDILLNTAATKLTCREHKNAFFAYIAGNTPPPSETLKQVLGKCPDGISGRSRALSLLLEECPKPGIR